MKKETRLLMLGWACYVLVVGFVFATAATLLSGNWLIAVLSLFGIMIFMHTGDQCFKAWIKEVALEASRRYEEKRDI